MSEPIMKFEIKLDRPGITKLRSPFGAVSIFPFTGRVASPLFTGEIRPGAVDVQEENPAGLRRLDAKYVFEGTDSAGKPCLLYVENVGYLTGTEEPGAVIRAYPRFLTDSEALAPYLSQARFRSELHLGSGELEIWVFDAAAEVSDQRQVGALTTSH